MSRLPKSGIIEGTLNSEETTPDGNDALASPVFLAAATMQADFLW